MVPFKAMCSIVFNFICDDQNSHLSTCMMIQCWLPCTFHEFSWNADHITLNNNQSINNILRWTIWMLLAHVRLMNKLLIGLCNWNFSEIWVIVVLLSKFSDIWRQEHVNFQWEDDEVRFVPDQHAELGFYSANNSLRVDISLHSDTLFWFQANQSLLFLIHAACLAEKQPIPIL